MPEHEAPRRAELGDSQRHSAQNQLLVSLGVVVTLGAVAVALVVLFTQVSVADGTTTRSCGSFFDTVVDRTGWEAWWAADLAETDGSLRNALLRSKECPDALNSQFAMVAAAAAAGLAVGFFTWRQAGGDGARRLSRRQQRDRRLSRLGRLSFVAGSALTALGVGGLILLVSDREATLFIYVDRRVVAIAGLVILIPPAALLVLGRALSILSDHLEDNS